MPLVCFTGGEIFARRDFLDIYTYAKKKGFIITLFTNGTLITPKIADYLAEWRPFAIEITLYGRTKETYERLTRSPRVVRPVPSRHPDCFRSAACRCRSRPSPFRSTSTRSGDMKSFVEEDLGLRFKFDPMINPRIDCSLSPLEVRLSPPEIVEMDLAGRRTRRGMGELFLPFHRPSSMRPGTKTSSITAAAASAPSLSTLRAR